MATKFTINYLNEYLPVRYSVTSAQQQTRRDVYSFKDGRCPQHIKDSLIRTRIEITAS